MKKHNFRFTVSGYDQPVEIEILDKRNSLRLKTNLEEVFVNATDTHVDLVEDMLMCLISSLDYSEEAELSENLQDFIEVAFNVQDE